MTSDRMQSDTKMSPRITAEEIGQHAITPRRLTGQDLVDYEFVVEDRARGGEFANKTKAGLHNWFLENTQLDCDRYTFTANLDKDVEARRRELRKTEAADAAGAKTRRAKGQNGQQQRKGRKR